RAFGIQPDVVPARFVSTELLPLLPPGRIAVIRAAKGNDDLIDALRARGDEVALGIAYETKAATGLDELRALIDSIDVVTFTSASTVDNFYGPLTEDERRRVNARALLASIGPTTSDAIRRYCKEPEIVAEEASIESLVDAILVHLTMNAER